MTFSYRFFVVLLVLTSQSNAQTEEAVVKLRLDEVIQLVVKHNASLRVSEVGIEQAAAAIKTAGALPTRA